MKKLGKNEELIEVAFGDGYDTGFQDGKIEGVRLALMQVEDIMNGVALPPPQELSEHRYFFRRFEDLMKIIPKKKLDKLKC